MNTVGIVTFTTGDNFGQRLQNYALQEVFKKNGCIVKTIRKRDFRLTRKYAIKKLIKSVYSHKVRKALQRHRLFVDFDKEYIDYYNRVINADNIPTCLISDFDKFVAGSDQVWNPYSGDVDDFNFLTFANDNQKYSYAASISADDLPDSIVDLYRERLQTFKNISVRETCGKKIINEILDKKVTVNLDPTLLITADEWKRIEKKPHWLSDKNYLLVYVLGDNKKDIIKKYEMKSGLLVIDMLDPLGVGYVSGPAEFLYLIDHADAILTDSYHGTIFSLIFGKKFIQTDRIDANNNMKSRFETLYEMLDIYSEPGLFDGNDGIQVNNIENKLKEKRKESFSVIEEICK